MTIRTLHANGGQVGASCYDAHNHMNILGAVSIRQHGTIGSRELLLACRLLPALRDVGLLAVRMKHMRL